MQPPTEFRVLTTHVMPLCGEEAAPHGLFLIQSLRSNGLIADREEIHEVDPATWRKDGVMVQCACCRRARDPRDLR